jgi:hypothetical protein
MEDAKKIKIAYNTCVGRFSFSQDALAIFFEISGLDDERLVYSLPRHHPFIVTPIEALGEGASGVFSSLKLLEVDVGQEYFIDYFDGRESVVFPEDIEWIVAE